MAMKPDVLQNLLDSMAPLDETAKYARTLFYGEPGSGKTVAACSFGERILYVESDPMGWVSLENHPVLKSRVHRMPYQGLSQLEAIAQAVEEDIPFFRQFDHIVLDTFSNMANLDLDRVVATRAAKDKGKSEDFPTQPDYGFNTERMRKVLNRILVLPVHVTMTSHQREDKDERTGRMYIRPDFTPKLRKTIEGFCHLIAYMVATGEGVDDDGEVKYSRTAQFHPTRGITAKSRIGGLPVTQKDPDIGKIINDWLAKGGTVSKEIEAPNVEEEPSLVRTSEDELSNLEI